MLTAGDVQFQPASEKIWKLTSAIAVLVAGDIQLHTEIFAATNVQISQRIEADPKRWLSVADVANQYALQFQNARNRRVEKSLLWPLGLTFAKFTSEQRTLDSQLVGKLSVELLNFAMPDVEAIVCGHDTAGPHIFIVTGERVDCRDRVGFAAIGAGAWHANSQLMFAGHVPSGSEAKTAYMVLAAKKRAEVAPGVGSETDMAVAGPHLGTFNSIDDDVVRELTGIYNKTVARQEEESVNAEKEVTTYFDGLASQVQLQVATEPAEPSDGTPPPDGSAPGASPTAEAQAGSEQVN